MTEAEGPRPGYEPFPVERRKRKWLGPVDVQLRRRLPERAYVPMLAGYHAVRRITGRNPGRGRLLPDFVIIGAAKAGTTSLYAWLAEHPFVQRATAKEVDYFTWHYRRGNDWYRGHFPRSQERRAFAAEHGRPFLTGEGSPTYMWMPVVPERMHKLLPDTKLIVSLRDPVDRAYSQFHMRRRDGEEPVEDFLTAVALEDPTVDGGRARERATQQDAEVGRTYLSRGRYAEQLERWFNLYPREQFFLTSTDALETDPHAEFERLQRFLELPLHRPERLEARFTSSYDPLADEARAMVRDYFRPHNERLNELLGRDFGW